MQTLDQSKSYYRRLTALDVITFMMVIVCLFFTKGYLISLLLIAVYPISHSKVLVSETRTNSDKIWVRKMDWDYYRKNHQIGLLSQYSSQVTSHIDQVNL
ncbi:hypothetical protein [Companilactobacillus futsaii]|uniref:Uncharacterized protein n=2 Tax=Companilactobacillus futsaii TaxID=938155 RepID=A0A5B7SXV9_9LACO|nr:hypothetical protein [Companilactobacillus futsaii]QCX24213.1 hypothetical protein FG051_03420 [Companilactobacillus futsaii]